MPVRSGLSSASRAIRAICAATALVTFAAVGAVAGPAQAATQPIGMDISSWQHVGGHSINWQSVRAAGHSFVIVKATEGTGYVNPYFAGDSLDAQRAGLVRAAYHYARPARPVVTDAVAEAQYFVATAGTLAGPGVLPPVLDLEETGGLGASDLIQWTKSWLATVQQLTGRAPMIYTYRYFWANDMSGTSAFTGYPLWLADYNSTFGGTVGGWPSWAIWQYTAGAAVPGVYGNVDMNRFNGTSAQLLSLANGAPVPPPAVTVPAPPASVTATPVDATGAAQLTWQPGSNGGSAITSYAVTAQPGGATVTVQAPQTATTVVGLDPSVAYTFSVTATNAVGSSAPATTGLAPAGPGPTPTPVPVAAPPVRAMTTLAIVGQSPTISYGASTALSARLTRAATKTALAGRSVVLEARSATTGLYLAVTTLTTNADGVVSTVLTPRATTQYRFRFAGTNAGVGSGNPTGERPSIAVAAVNVRVRIVSTLSATSVRAGQRLTMSGRVTPATSGYVYLQTVLNGRWTTLARTAIGRTGLFSFPVVPAVRGSRYYRVSTSTTSAYAGTYSATAYLHVR
ncbi:MAG: lysozyme [Frankiaceae bacterium]|nr:lysozyme [Frankiaceae bacterium]